MQQERTESLLLATECKQPSPQHSESRKQLIREWIVRFALNADKELDSRAVGIYESLWLEGFSDLSDSCLVAAFRKTIQSAKFWPVKIADVREHVTHAVSNATDEASEKAWARVLEIRRVHWNPDIPGPFNRALAGLSERVRQAARAANVFREFTAEEYENGALHTWAKKRFFESFNSWGEREQDKFLLPDGEIKNLLAEFSETKALPASQICFEDLHKRGLQYAEEYKVLSAWESAADGLPEFDAETRAEIETELAGYAERFSAALEKRQATQ